MRTSLRMLSLMALALLVACNTPETDGTDAGDRPDTGGETIDSGSSDVDSGSEDVDSGSEEVDSGSSEDVDSGSEDVDGGESDVDAGAADVDGGSCVEPGLGDSCGDTAGGAPCATGYECDLGRCLPQDRTTCGGFAGARCTDAVRSVCLYQPGHGDVGTCFSPSEVSCLCALDSRRWSC